MVQVNNITFGYSDSEDRLWVRLQLNNGKETNLWLTRRLTSALCQAITQMIEKNTLENTASLSTEALNKELRREFFEISQSTWDPTPAAPTPDQISSNHITGLCHTIQIDSGDNWQIRLLGPGQQIYVLPIDRHLIQKLLLAIIKQAELAQWEITPTNQWLRTCLTN